MLYSEIMVEITDFGLPHLYLVLSLGVTSLEFHRYLSFQKWDSWAIVRRCVPDPTSSRLVTERETDRHTDIHTHDDSTIRASIASRMVYSFLFLFSYIRLIVTSVGSFVMK